MNERIVLVGSSVTAQSLPIVAFIWATVLVWEFPLVLLTLPIFFAVGSWISYVTLFVYWAFDRFIESSMRVQQSGPGELVISGSVLALVALSGVSVLACVGVVPLTASVLTMDQPNIDSEFVNIGILLWACGYGLAFMYFMNKYTDVYLEDSISFILVLALSQVMCFSLVLESTLAKAICFFILGAIWLILLVSLYFSSLLKTR